MNKDRRKELEEIVSELETLRERIATAGGEERDYYDNMPESLQQGDKGQAADQAANCLEAAEGDLDTVIDNINEALQS